MFQTEVVGSRQVTRRIRSGGRLPTARPPSRGASTKMSSSRTFRSRTQSLHLARQRKRNSTRSHLISAKRNGVGSICTPTALMRTGPPSSSRPRKELAKRRHRQDGHADESIALCEKLFAERLDGNALDFQRPPPAGSALWLKFNRVLCEQWHHKNIVLIGDAAHTAHFGIGSGTKLAMEDAMALAASACTDDTKARSPARCSATRTSARSKRSSCRAPPAIAWNGSNKSNATRISSREQFTYSLLTGSQRIGHENLKVRDAEYVAECRTMVCRAQRRRTMPCRRCSRRSRSAVLTLKNRVIVSPMATYMAVDGVPNDFHLVHLWPARYGRRRDGRHGNDLRLATWPHHSGVPRHVE